MREKKAKDIVIFHVARLTTIADYFLICSAESQRQVKAIMDSVQSAFAKSGEKPFSVEGEDSLRWVLMDYSDLVIHVFDRELRSFYALEHLWGDAPRVTLEQLASAPRKRKMVPPARRVGRTSARRGRAL